MKESFDTKLYGWFYGSSCKKQLKNQFSNAVVKAVNKEYKAIIHRAKDIGKSRLMNAYCMGAYFISLNRNTGLTPQENYELFRNGLYANTLLKKALGNAESYLDKRKMAGRMEWSVISHKCQYENDWIVDVLEGNQDFDLGYNYLQCGICKLCKDEGGLEIAKYICKLDYVLADMMGMKLERTTTIAEGGKCCDFRYSRK